MMQTLPPATLTLLAPFAPRFSPCVWRHALVLVAGTLLAPGTRTVCAALRAMGPHQTRHRTRYHRVLNRAKWSGLAVSRMLLGLLVAAFAPEGPLVLGLDETIERRWGARMELPHHQHGHPMMWSEKRGCPDAAYPPPAALEAALLLLSNHAV